MRSTIVRKILFLASCIIVFSSFCILAFIALYFYRMQVGLFTIEEMSAFLQSNIAESFEFVVSFFLERKIEF